MIRLRTRDKVLGRRVVRKRYPKRTLLLSKKNTVNKGIEHKIRKAFTQFAKQKNNARSNDRNHVSPTLGTFGQFTINSASNNHTINDEASELDYVNNGKLANFTERSLNSTSEPESS